MTTVARERLTAELRGALVAVLCERLDGADEIAIAIYRADSHARQLAAEIGERQAHLPEQLTETRTTA